MTPIIGPRHTNTSMADRDRIVAETQARAHQAALADAADGDPGETKRTARPTQPGTCPGTSASSANGLARMTGA